MPKNPIKEALADSIIHYKCMLLDYLSANPDVDKLITEVYFCNSIQASGWVDSVNPTSFDYFECVSPANHGYLQFKDLDQIQFNPVFVQIDEVASLGLFKQLEFETVEDAKRNMPGYFYFCREDFVAVLDSLFRKKLNGFTEINNDLVKTYARGAKLILHNDYNRMYFESILEYKFPYLKLEFKNDGHFFATEFDTYQFLFLTGYSFFQFFEMNRYFLNRKGEPIVYYFEDTGKYIISNSLENIDRFNKYISINLDVYFRLFELFQEWLVRHLLPTLEQNNK